jgi:hypothetical protein
MDLLENLAAGEAGRTTRGNTFLTHGWEKQWRAASSTSHMGGEKETGMVASTTSLPSLRRVESALCACDDGESRCSGSTAYVPEHQRETNGTEMRRALRSIFRGRYIFLLNVIIPFWALFLRFSVFFGK